MKLILNRGNRGIENTLNRGLIVFSIFFSLFFLIADFSISAVIYVIAIAILEFLIFMISLPRLKNTRLTSVNVYIFIIMLVILFNLRNREYINEQPFYIFSLIMFFVVTLFIKPGYVERRKALNVCLLSCFFTCLIVIISRFAPALFSSMYLNIISDTSRRYNIWIMGEGYSGVVGREISRTAQYIVVGASILFGRYLSGKDKHNFILLLATIGCLFLTGRRSEPLAFVVAVLLVLYITIDGRKKKNYIILGLSVILIGIVVYFLILTNAITYNGENRIIKSVFMLIHGADVSNGRNVLYGEAIRLFKEHPFVGIGWGGFRKYSRSILSMTTNVHNVYLQLLCEIGILGVAVLAVPFIALLVYSYKQLKTYQYTDYYQFVVFGFLMTIYLFVYSFLDNAFYHDEFWLLFAIVLFCSHNLTGYVDPSASYVIYTVNDGRFDKQYE